MDEKKFDEQSKICLFNLVSKLNNAIQHNDRRGIIYFLGLLSRYQYHPTIDWNTLVPIDMLLLQKTPRCLRKGHQDHCKESQIVKTKGFRRGRRRRRGRGKAKKEKEKSPKTTPKEPN